ncbi:hypothetical protein OG422_00660 [Streptomyces sp. NBC_01525]|uniref:hypothetical protein n=1 Tax=Streptomyces sp. NBC_01525 TaxID=2903893 RepID=UPI003865C499
MRHAAVTPAGDRIRWIEHRDDGTGRPARVHLHGLGASSPVHWNATDANLDALEPERGAGGSRGIAARTALA